MKETKIMGEIREYGGQNSMNPSSGFHLGDSSKREVGGNRGTETEIQDNGWSLNIPPINITNDFELIARELRGWHRLMHPAISQEERDVIFNAFADGLQFHLVHNPAHIDDRCNHVVLTAGLSRRYLVVSNEAVNKIKLWTGGKV